MMKSMASLLYHHEVIINNEIIIYNIIYLP